jgi:hypothetical protein
MRRGRPFLATRSEGGAETLKVIQANLALFGDDDEEAAN